MLTSVVRRVLAIPCRFPAGRRLARRVRSRRLAILMYHGVTAEPLPIFNWCQLHAAEFEKQVGLLSREYQVLPLTEVVDRLDRRAPLPERAACLTFDDGFRNVFTTAYPILKRYQVPATVFLVTSLIGTRQPAWPDRLYFAVANTTRTSVRFQGVSWQLENPQERSATHRALARELKALPIDIQERRLAELLLELGEKPVPEDSPLATMDWREVDELARSGLIHFGSHTHTHPILSQCSPDRQRDELLLSRNILRDRLGTADLLAYPNGTRKDFTDATKQFVAELGYRAAATTVSGLERLRGDLFELRRVGIGADTSLAQFELRLLGL